MGMALDICKPLGHADQMAGFETQAGPGEDATEDIFRFSHQVFVGNSEGAVCILEVLQAGSVCIDPALGRAADVAHVGLYLRSDNIKAIALEVKIPCIGISFDDVFQMVGVPGCLVAPAVRCEAVFLCHEGVERIVEVTQCALVLRCIFQRFG